MISYALLIKRSAKKTLLKLSRTDRVRITEKIVALGANPSDPMLDIKPLEGQPLFRLRVGDWRIIFSKDDFIKIIGIEDIKSRGDAYK